ncbi:MAG: hypothetical protein WD491_00820 [Balneolales bacterium]
MDNHHKLAWLYILALALVLQFFMPWWTIALASAVVSILLGKNGMHAFISGFAGIGLLWLIIAGYIHYVNEGILSNRIAVMMDLPNGLFVIFVTALLGALVGGFSSLTGYLIKDITSGKKVEHQRAS